MTATPVYRPLQTDEGAGYRNNYRRRKRYRFDVVTDESANVVAVADGVKEVSCVDGADGGGLLSLIGRWRHNRHRHRCSRL